jgi:hypothetical protein
MWGNLDGKFLFISFWNLVRILPGSGSTRSRSMLVRDAGSGPSFGSAYNLCRSGTPGQSRVNIYPYGDQGRRLSGSKKIFQRELGSGFGSCGKVPFCSSTTAEWGQKLVSRIRMLVLDPEILDPGSWPQRNRIRFKICTFAKIGNSNAQLPDRLSYTALSSSHRYE